jgi:general secretion pathway protein D
MSKLIERFSPGRWKIPVIMCFLRAMAAAGFVGAATTDLEEESLLLREMGGVDSLYGKREQNDTVAELNGGKIVVDKQETPELLELDKDEAVSRRFTRDAMLEEVDSSWQRPLVFQRSMTTANTNEQDQILEQLEHIFIPKVEFRELPLSQVVETLSEISLKQSPDGNGLNIVLIDPEGRDPRVSILLRRLSLKRVLDFVVESSGCEYDLQKDAVVIRPRQGPGMGLETAFYPITRSTLIRLTGLPEMEELVGTTEIQDPFAMVVKPKEDSRGKAESALKSFLQRAGIPFSGVEGADLALADGQLIVTQTTRNHEKVRQLLRRYREIKQVEIEARGRAWPGVDTCNPGWK